MLCIRWQYPEPEIHREIKQEFKKEGRKLLLRATITILQNGDNGESAGYNKKE